MVFDKIPLTFSKIVPPTIKSIQTGRPASFVNQRRSWPHKAVELNVKHLSEAGNPEDEPFVILWGERLSNCGTADTIDRKTAEQTRDDYTGWVSSVRST